MMSPPGPARTLQGNGAPLRAKAPRPGAGRKPAGDVSARTGGDSPRQQRAPEREGQRRAESVSDRPAEARQGSGAPWGMKAGAGEPGLWAEGQAVVCRLLMEAHYLETVWQDCPANKRLAAEYSRNVL